MSPEVEELVAREDVVVVVAVAVPLAMLSDGRMSSGPWQPAPSLSESVDSPVNGIERIWLARCVAKIWLNHIIRNFTPESQFYKTLTPKFTQPNAKKGRCFKCSILYKPYSQNSPQQMPKHIGVINFLFHNNSVQYFCVLFSVCIF